MTDMTPSELRAAWEKTSAGPWTSRTVHDAYKAYWVEIKGAEVEIATLDSPGQTISSLEDNAAFIVLAHHEWPRLVGAVEALQALHDAVRGLTARTLDGVVFFEASPLEDDKALHAWQALDAAQKLATTALSPTKQEPEKP